MKLITTLADIPLHYPVYLYGTGQAGINFHKILSRFLPKLVIRGFIDSHNGGTLLDLPVYPLERFLNHETGDCLILIVSGAWREIESGIKERGIRRYFVIPPRFLYPSGYQRLLESVIDPLHDSLTAFLFSPSDREFHETERNQVLRLFENEAHRYLYRILTGDHPDFSRILDAVSHYYYHTPIGRQYFEFIRYQHVRTMVEGGVAGGAETLQFWQKMNQHGRIFGFEPDYPAFLQSPHRQQIDRITGITVRPCGLWSTAGKLGFVPAGLSSHVTVIDQNKPFPPGMQTIDVVSVDLWKQQQGIDKIDFIKLDIEGAETDALEGARQTIIRDRPQMAVCLYHKKEHFFQIPLLLDQWLDNYAYYLGHYSAGNLETVLYAVPREFV